MSNIRSAVSRLNRAVRPFVPHLLKREVTAAVAPKRPSDYQVVGRSVGRVDLPAKLSGLPAYVQDMRLPGMVFARVLRPPRYNAKLLAVDENAARSVAGFVALVREGSFLAVVAEREEQAIAAREVLAAKVRWSDEGTSLPDMRNLHNELKQLRSEAIVSARTGQENPAPAAARRLA